MKQNTLGESSSFNRSSVQIRGQEHIRCEYRQNKNVEESEEEFDNRSSNSRKRKSMDRSDLLKSSKEASFEPPTDLGGQQLKHTPCKKITEMKDSYSLLDDMDAIGLYERFFSCGYLYLKNALNRNQIMKANANIRNSLQEIEMIDDEGNVIGKKKGGVLDINYGTFISGQDIDTGPEGELQWIKIGKSKELKTVMNDGI